MHEPFITQQAQLQTKPWINCSVKHYHIEGKKQQMLQITI